MYDINKERAQISIRLYAYQVMSAKNNEIFERIMEIMKNKHQNLKNKEENNEFSFWRSLQH